MNIKSWVPNYSLPVWARRSRYYLMEFVAGLVGLTIVTFLLDRIVFALAKYLSDAAATSSGYDQMNIWAIAMLVVWLPIALLFFARSRFEEMDRPAVARTKLRRFFLYVFMLVMLFAAASLAISTVYSILAILFGANEAGDTLLTQTAPALIGSLIHAYVFRSFMKNVTAVQIKEVVATIGALSAVILAAILIMTSLQARNSLVDQKTSQDLQVISTKVDDYYRQSGKLPGSLSDLRLEKSIERRGQKHNYSYQKRGSYGYKLCADFKAAGTGNAQRQEILSSKRLIYPTPRASDNFYQHEKGNQCFELSVGSGISPMYEEDASGQTESGASGLDSLLKGSSGY